MIDRVGMAGRPLQLAICLNTLVIFLASGTSSFAQGSTIERLKSSAERVLAPLTGKTDDRLHQVTTFEYQVTGVTVAEDGRIFVNFPRWTDDVPVSVAEMQKDGSIKPYPDSEWNSWRNVRIAEVPAADHFVTVQSVVADGRGSLWVVDPAAPNAEKTVKGGPKVVQIDLGSNRVKRVFGLGPDVAGPASYLNDIRIAPDGSFAYLTDSGVPGGLVVLDLGSGPAWRALSDAPPTTMDLRVTVMTDGKPLRRPDGRQPMFNADGIALSPDGNYLYWQALTGKTLYRIETSALRTAQSQDITSRVETVAETEPVDGLWMDKSGRLYLSSIAQNAVKVLERDGKQRTFITDSRLRWPDTFAQGPDGTMYVTASHIQDSPWFHPSGWTDKNFALFRFRYEPETTGTTK
jgi:sugar lactone lactonase YvrE